MAFFGNETDDLRNLLTFLHTDRKVYNEKWITTSILFINTLIAGPGNVVVSVFRNYRTVLGLVPIIVTKLTKNKNNEYVSV